MARVKIPLPDRWDHQHGLTVRITDVNYGGHVGNDTLLAFLQEARVDWLRRLGYPSELLAPPVGLILVDLSVRLKAEAKYADQLEIRLAVSEWTRTGFELVYQVYRPANATEIARATTGFAFYDYTAGHLAAAPPDFRARAAGAAPAP